jgi:hypothetical protein
VVVAVNIAHALGDARARARIRRAAEANLEPPEPGRFQRVCPYCHEPLFWRSWADPIEQRPVCPNHGPLRLWRVIDTQWIVRVGERPIPAVVAFGHLWAEVSSRMLRTPVVVEKTRLASPRWRRPPKDDGRGEARGKRDAALQLQLYYEGRAAR